MYKIPCVRCGTPFLSFHLSAKHCKSCKREINNTAQRRYIRKKRKNKIYTNYIEMPNKIRNFTPFKSNSAYAIREGKKYVIVSCNTTIAEIDMTKPIVTYFNKEKYSNIITRLQNIIQKVIEEEQWHTQGVNMTQYCSSCGATITKKCRKVSTPIQRRGRYAKEERPIKCCKNPDFRVCPNKDCEGEAIICLNCGYYYGMITW